MVLPSALWKPFLLFAFAASCFGSSLAESCSCRNPVIVGVVPVVSGKIICKNLQEIPRDFFTRIQTRPECQQCISSPVELDFEDIGKPLSLSPSSFDLPTKKLIIKRINFKMLCLEKIAPKFFDGFLDPSSLAALSFQDVRCLQAVQEGAFANLLRLNTFRWSGGSLQQIQAGAFSGLPALEEFTVQNTKLQALPPRLFAEPTSLGDIVLTNNRIEVIPASFFKFKSKIVKLNLAGNRIKRLPDGLLSDLKLHALDLQENLLVDFTVAILGASNQKNITSIKLSNNKLTKLSRNVVAGRSIEKLSLDVDGNPWNCDCSLHWFSRFFGGGEPNIICASPPALKDRKANSVGDYEFCPTTGPLVKLEMGGGGGISRSKDPAYKTVTEAPKMKGASIGGGGPQKEELIAIGTSVVVIIIALVCFFLIYRYRGRICKSKEKTRKQEYQPANMEEGYDGEPPMRTYVS